MKRFFESLKDLIYDSVDYLIMITIIGIVVVVIGWRINILFAEKPIESPPVSIEDREDDKGDNEGNIEESQESQEALVDPENTETEENKETPASGQVITVIIPGGSLPNKIGEILASHGLIANKEDFVKKSQEMNLDTKLRSGNFDIEVGTSLENIVKIIAR